MKLGFGYRSPYVYWAPTISVMGLIEVTDVMPNGTTIGTLVASDGGMPEYSVTGSVFEMVGNEIRLLRNWLINFLASELTVTISAPGYEPLPLTISLRKIL